MKAYQQRRVQVAANAVYRTTALILRSLEVTEAQVEAACQTLSSQAPEKFSRKVFMEVFLGGPDVAEAYHQKDVESLAASKKDAVLRSRVAHLRKKHERDPTSST